MYKFRNVSMYFVSFCLLVLLFFSVSTFSFAGKDFISIATGSTGGSFYPCGVIFAHHFDANLAGEDYKFSAHASGVRFFCKGNVSR